MFKRGFVTDTRRTNLDKVNSLFLPLIETAADIEALIFLKLFFEKKIKASLMDNWTLGTYLKWAKEYNFFKNEDLRVLSIFNELRNAAVHGRFIIINAEKDSKKHDFIKEIILKVLDIIDNNHAEYLSADELEKEYATHMTKLNQRYQKIFDK